MIESESGQTLVLALGNPLMGDDGFGLAVLDVLRRTGLVPSTVTLMDGGTWGMNLLPAIEAAGQLILIDAIKVGAEPGSVVRLVRDQLPRCFSHKISPHQMDLREVLALAELRGHLPAELVALGVQPEDVSFRQSLSPVVEAKVGMVAELTLRQLAEWEDRSNLLAVAIA
ncbi:MAG: HyaD/HybD family hydrogenase maturation endopeptidase [Gemmatimonadota bacterium]